MSNEVNIVEIAYGTLDPGVAWDIYNWTDGEADYNRARVKARFFSLIPDPVIPFGGGVKVEEAAGKIELEIIRTWSTVWNWWDDATQKPAHSFQRNVSIKNVGDYTAAYHLLRAETDNE